MTRRMRQIAAAIRRSEELMLMKALGYRAEQTWRNLRKIKSDLDDTLQSSLDEHFCKGLGGGFGGIDGALPASTDGMPVCEVEGMEVRASDREAHRWLRGG